MCHQGLGFEKMFECFRYQGASLEETLAQYRVTPVTQKGSGYAVQHIIRPAVTDMFALDLVTVEERVFLQSDGSFSGIYVLSGEGSMNGAPIDIFHLFEDEKPAGKHGFLTVQSDRFVFEDGTPVRF